MVKTVSLRSATIHLIMYSCRQRDKFSVTFNRIYEEVCTENQFSLAYPSFFYVMLNLIQ